MWVATARALEGLGNGMCAGGPEKLLFPLVDGEQAHNAFFLFDDSSVPVFEVDAQRLGETADNVVDQRVALRGFP